MLLGLARPVVSPAFSRGVSTQRSARSWNAAAVYPEPLQWLSGSTRAESHPLSNTKMHKSLRGEFHNPSSAPAERWPHRQQPPANSPSLSAGRGRGRVPPAGTATVPRLPVLCPGGR